MALFSTADILEGLTTRQVHVLYSCTGYRIKMHVSLQVHA